MKFEVLDLTGTSLSLQELTHEEKAELEIEKCYWEFSSEDELENFAQEIADEVEDSIEVDAVSYLELMNYQVKGDK